ncbi:MAG TPA: IS1595 family transposase [Hyphomicrobiaceae bacterium]|nr:IS1595 family transposase [Hyphomicrobiaceae bacterium]
MSLLSQKHLQDEEAAYQWVEAHIWPNGPVCAHCGETKRVSKMQGKATRIGLYKCYACRKQFNVKIGTIFGSSHVPMHLWLQAFYLLAGSKKGISSNQLHRTLGVTLKTAWFMSHRIREAMRTGTLAAPMGGNGSSGVVEADETFIGRKKGQPKRRAYHHKHAVLSLVERGGEVRSFHVEKADAETIAPIVNENIAKEARLMTDEAKYYRRVGREFAGHETVNHGAGEYVRGDAHTNTLENYYSIFKRGMKGVYQHCGEQHLHRYVSEFDFRYNNRVAHGVDDSERAARAVKGVVGKRLTYRPTRGEVTDAQEEIPF